MAHFSSFLLKEKRQWDRGRNERHTHFIAKRRLLEIYTYTFCGNCILNTSHKFLFKIKQYSMMYFVLFMKIFFL